MFAHDNVRTLFGECDTIFFNTMSFSHLETIYRNYDIRGKYPEELTAEEVEKIAHALTRLYSPKKVAIGYDIRPSGKVLFEALAKGFTESGVDVIDLGLVTTPMTYYVSGSTDVEIAVMITASHMPSEYNGLKICVEDAKPVTADVLQTIRDIVGTHTFSAVETVGNVSTHAVQQEWIEKFKGQHDLSGSNFSIVIDPANMIGALEIETFKAFQPELTVHAIYDNFDSTTPNHEANPMKLETMNDLGEEVRNRQADLGIALDGDADRVGFVDENGVPIPADIIGMLLAKELLTRHPESTVIYDVRSTKALPELVKSLGGTAIKEKVGHTNIRTTMREHNAVLGIELAGHYFFRDSYFSEGGPLPVFLILELMKREKKTLSELVKSVVKYYATGEINSTISRTPEEIYQSLSEAFPEAQKETFDGLSLLTESWWCTVRPSANDPVMRMTLEAVDQQTMEQMRDKVLTRIRN